MQKFIKYNDLFVWTNNNVKNVNQNIELSVALPAYKAKNIIWLALESLKNQINIPCNWELIIIEEYNESFDIIEDFLDEFLNTNCSKIIYKPITTKISLLQKWIDIANLCSLTSKIYVMHATDCYSSPKRLYIHYQHFLNDDCYFSTQLKGIFFNLINKKKIIYDGTKIEQNLNNVKSNHLNMALKTNDMKYIPFNKISMGIDSYIRNQIIQLHKIPKNIKYIYTDEEIDKDNWKYSLDTDGCNTISLYRREMYDKISVFKNILLYDQNIKYYDYTKLEDYLPHYIIHKLYKF